MEYSKTIPKVGQRAVKSGAKDKSGIKEIDSTFTFDPIGVVLSPFKDKYGVPRQPALALAAKGIIKFKKDPDLITALKSMDQFSHLWILFVFHDHGGKNWKPSIRPPRLGGRQKVGVLASRSPHRPNPIGMSVVKIESIDLKTPGGPEISISGLDLIDQTPVLDVKPYITYADSIPEAVSGWAEGAIKKVSVALSAQASKFIAELGDKQEEFRSVLQEVLEQDPRPAYQKRNFPVESPESQGRRYGIEIMGFEVSYEINNQSLFVLKIN